MADFDSFASTNTIRSGLDAALALFERTLVGA